MYMCTCKSSQVSGICNLYKGQPNIHLWQFKGLANREEKDPCRRGHLYSGTSLLRTVTLGTTWSDLIKIIKKKIASYFRNGSISFSVHNIIIGSWDNRQHCSWLERCPYFRGPLPPPPNWITSRSAVLRVEIIAWGGSHNKYLSTLSSLQ